MAKGPRNLKVRKGSVLTEIKNTSVIDFTDISDEDMNKMIDGTLTDFDEGDLVDGTVVKIEHDEVLVEARHLVDGCTALQPDRPNVLGWQGVLLDGHHLLIADGCRLESLNAGRLARQPALAATTALADLAAIGALPEHRSPVRRVLEGFETRSLAAARSRSRSPVAA